MAICPVLGQTFSASGLRGRSIVDLENDCSRIGTTEDS